MGKGTFVIGLGVGYVLGARAGRERYEQLKERATGVWNNPRLRRQVDTAKHTATSAADTATHKIGEHLPGGGSDTAEQTNQERASAR